MGKLLWTVVISLVAGLNAFGQSKTITVVVTDKTDGQPAIGATVQVKGTSVGTATGMDGRYSIRAASGDMPDFRFIGMKTQELAIGDGKAINVEFECDNVVLDEVVVVGYGSAIRRELTGAITRVETRGIAEMPSASFESAIQGKT
ncbi:MAG: carboxypeptidase-like regulatory domain-containing protein [Bacteroidales bacterium]